MKQLFRLSLSLLLVLACVTLNAAQKDTLRILAIGNSFSWNAVEQNLSAIALADGKCAIIGNMYIGGCSLERHCSNIAVASTNDMFRPYKTTWSYASLEDQSAVPFAASLTKDEWTDGRTGRLRSEMKSNIPAMLVGDRWDVVTIQQASHLSWQPDSYHPFGDDLVATIRKLAPQARIMVQQTWSYTPYDARLKKWGIDPPAMHARLKAAYAAFAKAYKFEIIPTGDAVQHFRKAMPSPDGITGDPCGQPKGRDKFHLNREGEYLQACVWLGALFNCDVTKLSYRPDFLSEERAVQMRLSAKAALDARR